MTFPLARLVDAPTPSALVRYDFNDDEALAGRGVHADGFTLGAPSLLTSPDAVSVLYGDRSLSFRHEIRGSELDADAAIAVLSRELLRPSNWFLFQRSAFSRPSWWRLSATGPEALSFDRWYIDTKTGDPLPSRVDSSVFEVGITLTAENFGYGERITLGPYTVTQDMTGDNPMRVELPTIKGDAPTALRVTLDPQDNTGPGGEGMWEVATISGDDPLTDVVLTAAVDFAAGTGVALETDAEYMGGKYFQVTVDAGPDNSIMRLLAIVPGTLSMGRYRMQLRCTVTAGYDQRFLFHAERGEIVLPSVIATLNDGDDGRSFWVDLGEASFPTGDVPPVDGGSTLGESAIAVHIGTADESAGSIQVDALRLIPTDGPDVMTAKTLTSRFSLIGLGSGLTGVFDGDTESYWAFNATNYVDQSPTLAGGFPTLDPAAVRNLMLVTALDRGVGAGAPGDDYITDKGSQTTVTVFYHPRLLHFDGRP